MTIQLDYEASEPFAFDYETLIKRVIEYVLDYENCPYEALVEVIITDKETIKQVNKTQRNIDQATDVLSFPMLSYPEPSDFSWLEEEVVDYFEPDTGELILGDIMLCYEKVMEQAACFGHSVERELAFLTVHSMLHLCGYDHIEPQDQSIMEQRQKQIMEGLGISRSE